MTTSEPGGSEGTTHARRAVESAVTGEMTQTTPKPAPRPGPPRPGPRPGPAPSAVHAAAAAPSSDPHRFGRVDPDGTVWLISGAGERAIGSWQAGDTEAAFAHFGRRFDDLTPRSR